MKYFIVADVHGFYPQLVKALNDAGFDKDNPEHLFVSLGDLLDRGDYPRECINFVNSLERKILIRGNHEDLMEEALARWEFLYHDCLNGTTQTAYDLSGYGVDCFTEQDVIERMRSDDGYNTYINSLVDFYDDGKNVFVHGWIPSTYADDSSVGWKDARWANGMEQWNKGVRLPNKTIYCGHWHTSWGHSKLHKSSVEWDNPRSTNPEHQKACFDPFIDEGIVALDACTAYSHKINCFVVEGDK